MTVFGVLYNAVALFVLVGIPLGMLIAGDSRKRS